MLPPDRVRPRARSTPPSLTATGTIDHKLLAAVVSLLSLGLVMVFSASSGSALARSQDMFLVLRSQAFWAVVGSAAMMAVSRFDYRHLKVFAGPLLFLSFVLLGLVFVPGLGRTVGGGTRWIRVLGMSFQPSEVARLALILFLADYLARREAERDNFRQYVMPGLLVLGSLCVMILVQPNLSYTLILGTVGFLMIAVRYRHWQHMVWLGMSGVSLAALLIAREPYRMRRYLAFLDPWADPYGSGWNIIQSLYALASGGLWGLGIGRGRQKFEYLPQEHSDYIFAIIGEELGFMGAATVMGLFAFILWRGLRIAMRAQDTYGALLAYGLTMSITVQAIVNVSVVVGSIPPTGIPLPFISSGGTSLLASLIAVGILLSISRHEPVVRRREPRPEGGPRRRDPAVARKGGGG